MLDRLRQDPYVRALLALILGLMMLDFLFALLFGTANVYQRYIGVTYLLVQLLTWVIIGGFFYGVYILVREFLSPAIMKLESLLPEDPKCSQCKRILQKTWACCPDCGSVNILESSQA